MNIETITDRALYIIINTYDDYLQDYWKAWCNDVKRHIEHGTKRNYRNMDSMVLDSLQGFITCCQ